MDPLCTVCTECEWMNEWLIYTRVVSQLNEEKDLASAEIHAIPYMVSGKFFCRPWKGHGSIMNKSQSVQLDKLKRRAKVQSNPLLFAPRSRKTMVQVLVPWIFFTFLSFKLFIFTPCIHTDNTTPFSRSLHHFTLSPCWTHRTVTMSADYDYDEQVWMHTCNTF